MYETVPPDGGTSGTETAREVAIEQFQMRP
jgi:hypothetical protein